VIANRKSIRPANQRALRSGLPKPAKMLRESASRKALIATEEVTPELEAKKTEPIVTAKPKPGERLRKAEFEGRVVKLSGFNGSGKPVVIDFNSEETKLYGMPKGKESFRLYMVTRRTNLNPDESFIVKLELECKVSEVDELAYVNLTLPSRTYWQLSLHGLSKAELRRRLKEREEDERAVTKKGKRRKGKGN